MSQSTGISNHSKFEIDRHCCMSWCSATTLRRHNFLSTSSTDCNVSVRRQHDASNGHALTCDWWRLVIRHVLYYINYLFIKYASCINIRSAVQTISNFVAHTNALGSQVSLVREVLTLRQAYQISNYSEVTKVQQHVSGRCHFQEMIKKGFFFVQ